MKAIAKKLIDLFNKLFKREHIQNEENEIVEEAVMAEYKNIKVLLDPGHGGIIDGVYQTKGKRSPVWDDDSQYFEGEGNRKIVKGILRELKLEGIDVVNIVPENEDISLSERVKRANAYGKDSIYISVHSNAGGGTGFESYSYRKTGEAAEMNLVFYDEASKEFPEERMRYGDNNKGKTANFKVLRETIMPAVLTENFFMDTEHDCKDILMTKEGLESIIMFHVEAIKHIIKKD
jgi:N-acetylmuramoyl-L-alanine amidase